MRHATTTGLAWLVLALAAVPAAPATGPAQDPGSPEAQTGDSTSGQPAAAAAGRAVGPALPPELRALLIQEMNAILAASKAILDGLVRGQDEVVAEQAQGIHDSFILKRAMTAGQREALHAAAPHGFLERDRAFHALAAGLAAAARGGDQQRQRELFGQMLDACSGCHARYAADRFPGLRPEAEQGRR